MQKRPDVRKVQEKIDAKTAEAKKLTEQWEAERNRVDSRNKLREKLDAARIELEHAKRQADFAK
jgi:ATP-dependent Clp protease ATP-binding subunit ClpB